MNWSAAQMWSEFLTAHPTVITEAGAAGITAWAFGAGPEMETELAELVVAGTKRATDVFFPQNTGNWASPLTILSP